MESGRHGLACDYFVESLESWRPRRRNRSVGLSVFPEHHLPRLVLGFLACGYFVEILIYGRAAAPRAGRLRGDESEDSTRSRRRRRGDRARGGVRERAAESGTRGAPPLPLANPLFGLEVNAPVNNDKLIKAPTLEQIRAQKARHRESAGIGGYNFSP